MSKPVKELVRRELARRFEGLTSLAVVGFTGLDAVATNRVRGRLREKEIRLTVVKNSLAKQTFRQLGLEVAAELLSGPCAIAYGDDPDRVGVVAVVRELLDIHAEHPNLTVKAAVLEGQAFHEEEVEALSKFPTREEALAKVAGCVVAPAAKLAAAVLAPGAKIASLVKTVEDKHKAAPQAEAA